MQGACGLGRGNAMRGRTMALFMVVVLSLCSSKLVLADTYKVGDNAGWDIMSYDSWVANKTFVEGDILEFVYTNAHDVVEVSSTNYEACSPGSNTVFTDGDTKYTLSGVGTKYYICSVSNHCSRGMKVSINVVAAGTTPNATSPTSSTTPSNSSSPTTTTTTPPSSSPLSLPPSIFTFFLILGVTLVFLSS